MEILNTVSKFADGEQAVLATVIDVRGSGYRLPGARMLILADGITVGIVTGGCLEADVLERAKRVLESGRPEVFTYNTSEDENSVFSMNMGCRGVIRILLEPVGRDSTLISNLRMVRTTREKQIMATVVASYFPDDRRIGWHVFLNGVTDRRTYGLPQIMKKMHQISLRSFDANSEYKVETIKTDEGSFDIALEPIEPPISLLLFGAGADAVPLVRVASELGWQTTVHDHRPAFLTEERFSLAKNLVLQTIDEPPVIAADNRTAAVVMTHNYARDRFILPALLRSDVFYIGALGPKSRTEQLLEELAAEGQTFSDEQRAYLYAPVGLDIGADTPESIALSIVAEVQSVLRTRGGGHLRERAGSIYDRK